MCILSSCTPQVDCSQGSHAPPQHLIQRKMLQITIWPELPRQEVFVQMPLPQGHYQVVSVVPNHSGGGGGKEARNSITPNSVQPLHTSIMICRPWGVMFCCSRLVNKSSRAHIVSRYNGWKESQATSPMCDPTSSSGLLTARLLLPPPSHGHAIPPGREHLPPQRWVAGP